MTSILEIYDRLMVCGAPEYAGQTVKEIAAAGLPNGVSLLDWARFVKMIALTSNLPEEGAWLISAVNVPAIAATMHDLATQAVLKGKISKFDLVMDEK